MTLEDSAEHHLAQALKYYEEGKDFNSALEACEQAIDREPYLADAHNLRGTILEQMEKPLQALNAYKEAFVSRPGPFGGEGKPICAPGSIGCSE
ncbi:MAG: hypothetical protein JXB07_18040 [Anaerolineae bacterium]|nr:hypothetical protein [Anaerolineae bacterium]